MLVLTMERHLQSNLHQLEEGKMRYHLDKLKHQLGIVEDTNDFNQTMTSRNNDAISNRGNIISDYEADKSVKGSVKSFERLSHKGKVFSSRGSDKNDVISVTISNKSYKTQKDDVASVKSNQMKDLQVDGVKDDVKSFKSHVSSLKGENDSMISKAKSDNAEDDDVSSHKSASKAQNDDVKIEDFNNDITSEKSQNDVTNDFGMATLKIDDLKADTSQQDDEHLERGDAAVASQKIKSDVIDTEKSSVKSESDDTSEGDVTNNDDVTVGGYSDDDFEVDEDDEDF